MTKQKYKITLSYDGTHYSGWQIQPNATSIQSLIQGAIEKITKESVSVTGSGRTDAGVHAENQVAHFSLESMVEPQLLLRSLNGTLPKDIRIKSVETALDTFHARFGAKEKTYEYHICMGPISNPITRNFSHHVRTNLDMEAMKKAASHLQGKHDFRAFANDASKGSAAKSPVKNLTKLEIIETLDGLKFILTSNGFLYKMARNIVGALLAVGSGKITPDQLKEILEAKDRRKAPMAAPAKGLFLKDVLYKD